VDNYILAGEALGSNPLLITLVAGILGLFSGGALVALLRIKVDKEKIVVEAAQGAVVIQTNVIDNLNEELTRVRLELHSMQGIARAFESELVVLRKENVDLRKRVAALEEENGSSSVGGLV
jgi:uncharacterized protein involved in exopolysaccharide biosynthesis